MPLSSPLNAIRLPQGAPDEGNRVVPIVQNLKPLETVSVGFPSSQPRVSRVASIMVDATKTYTGFEVVFADTGRRIVIPSGSESCHRTFSSDGSFTVQNLDAQFNAIFRAFLFTCPQPVYERFPGASLAGDTVQNAGRGEFSINPGGKVATYPYALPVLPLGTAWDATLATPTAVLSQNSLLATLASTPGVAAGAMRAPAYRSTGKYYFELAISSTFYDGAGGVGTGIANAFQGDGKTTRNYADILLDQQSGIWLSGTKIASISNQSISNVTNGYALDIDRGLLWITQGNGKWNDNGAVPASDPVAGVGGIDVSALPKPWTPMLRNSFGNSYTLAAKLLTGLTSLGGGFAYAVPAGFQPGWPPV